MHIAEQVSNTFDQGSRERVCELSDDKIQILVKSLTKQLEDWKASLPAGDGGAYSEVSEMSMARLNRSYYSGRAYIHEVGLYGLLQGQIPSLTKISIIYECFTAAMKFLSDALELSLEEMTGWTNLDWRSLNFAVMLCTKSSIILDSSYPGNGRSERAEWLDKCLGTLCLRAKELHLMVGAPVGQDQYFRRLSTDWANLKLYYQNCMQRNLPQASATAANPASTMQPGFQSLDGQLDMDVFNDMFWTSYGDTEGMLSNIFQM